MKDALAKLNAEVIPVQSVQDLLEDIIVSFNSFHENEDVIDVGGDSFDSLQCLHNAAPETGTRVCQSEGHAFVLM